LTIKEARKQAGMTLKELAAAVGVSDVAICRYESGKRTPRPAIAKRIGKVLGIPWYEALDGGKEESS
jgi:transcriptional regulator with XRE-family HTH domain